MGSPPGQGDKMPRFIKIRYLQAERCETGASCVSSGVINGGLAPNKYHFLSGSQFRAELPNSTDTFYSRYQKKKSGETKEGNTHTPKAA
jgi:hypothetical protein